MANITFLFFLSPVGPVSLRLVMGASRELRRYGNFSVVGRAIMTGLRGVRGLGTFSGEGGATAEGRARRASARTRDLPWALLAHPLELPSHVFVPQSLLPPPHPLRNPSSTASLILLLPLLVDVLTVIVRLQAFLQVEFY